MSLLAFLEKGLRNTDSGLGDRSKYIGSSDIGQCPKKSFLSKTKGEEHSLNQLLIFARGHVAEGIVRNGLLNNPAKPHFEEQVEVVGIREMSYIRTHIDFVVHFPLEDVVVECKTISSPLPDGKPRQSWIFQVQLQIGLLKAKTGKETRGIIVAFDLNSGNALEFPVVASKLLFESAVQRATTLWGHVQLNNEPDGEISDLCGYCPFKLECSTLQKNGEKLPEEVDAMVSRLKEISPLEKEAMSIKENVKAFMEAANLRKGIGTRFSVMLSEREGRESVSIESLKTNYPEIANTLIKPGSAYKVLKVV